MQNVYHDQVLAYSILIPFKFLFNDLMLSSITIGLNTTTPGIELEPFDPGLSLLRPELAFQVMAEGYITVGTLAVSC